MHDMPEAPSDELAIAAVGPLTNFALALLFVVVGLGFGARLWPPTLFGGPWLARLLWMNVLLGTFNLLPAIPMDGGRVLRAALARRHDRRTATAMAARIARFCAGAMILLGFFYDFWLILIGIFVLLGASAEEQAANDASRHQDGTHGSSPPSGQHRVAAGDR
jgi:Zn-dependent protease